MFSSSLLYTYQDDFGIVQVRLEPGHGVGLGGILEFGQVDLQLALKLGHLLPPAPLVSRHLACTLSRVPPTGETLSSG
jgi:hypothetical protein